MTNSFGGKWTTEKLEILSDYLNFYVTALKKQSFDKIYIDAFAGTGVLERKDTGEIISGSTKISLDIKEKFDKYIFIENNKKSVEELKKHISKNYEKMISKINIIKNDANTALIDICKNYNFQKTRCVLFLDPFAMSVNWNTLKIISETKAIDVWYLFPIGATNRLLQKNKTIDIKWKEKLNSIFGENSWEKELYKTSTQLSLFGDSFYEKEDFLKLREYIIQRLKTVFPYVSDKSKILYNKNNSPLFLFCFAVSNPNSRAWRLAQKVANYILNKQRY